MALITVLPSTCNVHHGPVALVRCRPSHFECRSCEESPGGTDCPLQLHRFFIVVQTTRTGPLPRDARPSECGSCHRLCRVAVQTVGEPVEARGAPLGQCRLSCNHYSNYAPVAGIGFLGRLYRLADFLGDAI